MVEWLEYRKDFLSKVLIRMMAVGDDDGDLDDT